MSRIARAPIAPLASLLAAAALTLALAAAPAAPAYADDDEPRRSVTVTGTGIVKARPDTAHITTGVTTEADTARAALDANTAAMTRIVAGLKEAGLEAKHIQTTDVSVHPRYHRSKDGEPARIVGYRVVNAVSITVPGIERLGAILDTVVTLGSNQIGGISFSIAEERELQDEARKKAMSDAIRKARLYAEAAGAKLGKVATIAEQTHVSIPRHRLARAAIAAEAAPVTIEAGEEALQVQVTVSWELD